MSADPSTPAEAGARRFGLPLIGILLLALAVGVYFGWDEWTARVQFRDAVRAIDRRNFSDAMKHLEACRVAWPGDAEVAFLISRTARRQGDLNTASEQLDRAARLGWPPESIALERTLTRTQQGQHHLTEDSLIKAVRSGHPDSLMIVELLGPIYARTFSPGLAREMLEKWIELQPNCPTPHFWLADMNRRLGQTGASRDHLLRAVELDPDYRDAAVSLARDLLDARRAEQAKTYLDRLMAKAPQDREVRFLIARTNSELSQDARARELLESLLAEFPDDTEVLLELGKLELRAEHHEQAEKRLRLAFARAPFDGQVVLNLSKVLQARGKSEEAKPLRERFIQIEADQAKLTELTLKIQKEPRNADLRVEFATVLARNEQLRPAVDWLLTALEITPRSPRIHTELASIYEKLGQTENAQKHRDLARQLER